MLHTYSYYRLPYRVSHYVLTPQTVMRVVPRRLARNRLFRAGDGIVDTNYSNRKFFEHRGILLSGDTLLECGSRQVPSNRTLVLISSSSRMYNLLHSVPAWRGCELRAL